MDFPKSAWGRLIVVQHKPRHKFGTFHVESQGLNGLHRTQSQLTQPLSNPYSSITRITTSLTLKEQFACKSTPKRSTLYVAILCAGAAVEMGLRSVEERWRLVISIPMAKMAFSAANNG